MLNKTLAFVQMQTHIYINIMCSPFLQDDIKMSLDEQENEELK